MTRVENIDVANRLLQICMELDELQVFLRSKSDDYNAHILMDRTKILANLEEYFRDEPESE